MSNFLFKSLAEVKQALGRISNMVIIFLQNKDFNEILKKIQILVLTMFKQTVFV